MLEALSQDGRQVVLALRPESSTLAWCVVAGDLYLLRERGRVERLAPGAAEAELLLERSATLAPGGVSHLPFARDLDGDGRIDLVLPQADGLQLHFAGPEGLRAGPRVRHRANVRLRMPQGGRTSERLSVPGFTVEDQNGDGHVDLAFEDDDLLQFYWSAPDGRLPETPTFELDLDEIRSRLPPQEEGRLDPSNLFRALERRVNQRVEDFDGDGIHDLLLRQGRKVSLYRGTSTGVDRSRAVQVLRTSGNLLAAFGADDNGDGRRDLNLLRIEDASLAELLLWLIAGGSVQLDLFSYHQREPLVFDRKPSSRRTVELGFPALTRIGDEMEELSDLWREGLARRAVAADLDGDGRRDDLARIASDRVELFRDALEEEAAEIRDGLVWADLLRFYDERADGERSVDLELMELAAWVPLPGARLQERLRGRTPDSAFPLGEMPTASDDAKAGVLFVVDLDGDSVDDLVVVRSVSGNGPYHLSLLYSRDGTG